MAQRETKAQKEVVGRVMHEFKHGELESSRGGKVKSHKQAVAIALSEAGESKFESPEKNRQHLKKTEEKERHGETAMQQKEGRKKH
jgi:Family of unknown function (DUF6496)